MLRESLQSCEYLLCDIKQPAQHFLVGQAMQRPRQAVEAGREGEVGVGQGAADQVRGMRADVPSLVVCVDGLVQPRQLVHLLAVMACNASAGWSSAVTCLTVKPLLRVGRRAAQRQHLGTASVPEVKHSRPSGTAAQPLPSPCQHQRRPLHSCTAQSAAHGAAQAWLTHLVRQVGGPVEVAVVGDLFAAKVGVAVDEGRNARQLGDQVEGVLIDRVPVVFLGDALRIGLSEPAIRLQKKAPAHVSTCRAVSGTLQRKAL